MFDNTVSEDWRSDLFDLITATPNLNWLLLTKRIGNVLSIVPYDWTCPRRGRPANAWLGATVVNQAEADRDIPKLLAVPARVRFLSMEPLPGPVDLERGLECTGMPDCSRCDGKGIDWVIVGGESGPHARPMHPTWAVSLRNHAKPPVFPTSTSNGASGRRPSN